MFWLDWKMSSAIVQNCIIEKNKYFNADISYICIFSAGGFIFVLGWHIPAVSYGPMAGLTLCIYSDPADRSKFTNQLLSACSKEQEVRSLGLWPQGQTLKRHGSSAVIHLSVLFLTRACSLLVYRVGRVVTLLFERVQCGGGVVSPASQQTGPGSDFWTACVEFVVVLSAVKWQKSIVYLEINRGYSLLLLPFVLILMHLCLLFQTLDMIILD